MSKGKVKVTQQEITDEAIIDLYWNRNQSAIEETDKKYGKYVYSICYNILCDGSDSEECRNDTYLAVWNKIPPTRPYALQAFIAEIARRTAITRYRAKNRLKRIPSNLTESLEDLKDFLSDDDSVVGEIEARQLAEVINGFLKSIDRQRRLIFVYRYYFAKPVSEISKIVKISERAVYASLTSSREKLKTILIKEGYDL